MKALVVNAIGRGFEYEDVNIAAPNLGAKFSPRVDGCCQACRLSNHRVCHAGRRGRYTARDRRGQTRPRALWPIDGGGARGERVTSVGFELDADLESVLLAVAGAVGEHDRNAG